MLLKSKATRPDRHILGYRTVKLYIFNMYVLERGKKEKKTSYTIQGFNVR